MSDTSNLTLRPDATVSDDQVQYTATALVFRKNLSYDEWEQLGATLQGIGKAWQWWVGDWLNYGETRWGEKYAQAIDEGIDYQTARNAAWVSGAVELSLRRDKLSWSHHKEVAKLDPPEQKEWLEKAEANEWSVAELRTQLKPTRTPPPPPKGTYRVLYVDPPWRYEHAEPSRAIENQYPTMELDEIKQLKPPAAPDSVLFMWATSPKLTEALEVVEAWGFNYRTCMVWVKDKIGMGYYARQRHELLLVAKKGDGPVPAESDRPDSVVEAPRLEHSAKPPVVYDLLETMYPTETKIELFARNTRDGWESWGNEL